MSTRRLLIPAFLLAICLSSCGANQAAPDDATLSNIYTAAAITLAAQQNAATAEDIAPLPTDTPFPTLAPMLPAASTATATYSSSSYTAASSCNSSTYVSDVTVADGTEVAPGDTFTKTWKVANTGTCTWSSDYTIRFFSGNKMSGSATEIGQSVAPGETAEVSVELVAPDNEGTYTSYWSLANSSGTAFGQRVYVEIIVSDSAATSTATATPTYTPTSTSTTSSSTATPTYTPTSTPATPTDTQEPTATPTEDSSTTEGAGG